ncbi:olfactory receptor 1361-like [Gopherus evgoodei]|uniref:olfactory receptor 1361-like n=1 Tax=Gopherus evgoodei TaxID=1825980 RepID=UPI0011CEE744|nr:olfactory receptor 1361-like [Gopherus evgoodei]
MDSTNSSIHPDFLLLGFSSHPGQEHLLFSLFLCMYLLNLLGNLLILLLTRSDPRLRGSPMYFFLSHLSLVDVCFTSTIMPKMLANLRARGQGIPYTGCLVQMYFFVAFAITENFLLGVIALDRYLAICRPLRYAVLMSPLRRQALVGSSWLLAHLHSLLHTLLMSQLSFCGHTRLPHFFCDFQPLLALACSRKRLNELLSFLEGGVLVIGPFLLIVLSYARILWDVLRVPERRRKAFQTCGAHLAVVGLFYGTAISVYFRPLTSYSGDRDKLATVMYTVVTPTLNPFIYSLRNQDIKAALRQSLGRLRGAWRGWAQER